MVSTKPCAAELLIKLIDSDGRFNMPLVLEYWQPYSCGLLFGKIFSSYLRILIIECTEETGG